MKSRPMAAMHSLTYRPFRRVLPWVAALLLFSLAGAVFAQQEADPPARVAHLSSRQGSVVFAPQGEEDWTELPQNRPLTTGDRLWADRGARAELQLGSATLHLDGQTHLGFSEVDERTAQFLLQQGTLQARVREITQGENFEVGTPNVAVRAMQPGEYRVDVDPRTGHTRVAVISGLATVFGENGDSVNLVPGQQAAFAGRALAQVQVPRGGRDEFGAWAAERNRIEDQSIAARYVPRGVVGYAQLDPHGTWGEDPNLGAVWYPRVEVQDWAPYRYGRWSFIQPWGWTWIDDAPWGFAPFHYGRWTMIGNRWAWAPGRLAARPVYSPALVVFVGGGGSSVTVGTGPSVGWYPLAPGEAWWPTYRATPRYVNFANFNINLNAYPRNFSNHVWRQRPHAITGVREDDFRRGRPVHRDRQAVQPNVMNRAAIGVAPARPELRREREVNTVPRFQTAPPANERQVQPQRSWGGRDWAGREWNANRESSAGVPQGASVVREAPPAVREQFRAQREQDQLQRDAERNARQQQRQSEERRQQQEWPRQQQPRPQQLEGLQRQREARPPEQAPQRDRGQGWWQRDDDGGRGRGFHR
jgi:hypothetical protein